MKTADRRRRRRASSSPTTIFGIEPNVAVMHQVVTAQLAAKRAGTHSTKTRAEVSRRWREAVAPEGHRPGPPGLDPRRRSGAAAAWRTARSRATTRSGRPRRWCGSRCAPRSPTAPPRSKVIVVDDWGITEPKTKAGVQLLEASACARRASATHRVLARAVPHRGGRVEVVPQPRRAGADHPARGAEHLRRARERLARVLAGLARGDRRAVCADGEPSVVEADDDDDDDDDEVATT